MTAAAIHGARLLKSRPNSLQSWVRMTDRYVDWRGQTIVCSTNFGARLPCHLSDFIERKIAYFGVWEPHLTHYLMRNLERGQVFVDVGANIGYYTLLGASLVGESGKVVAIEAAPAIFRTLANNIHRNHAHNIRLVNMAVSDREGELAIRPGPSRNSGLTSTVSADGAQPELRVRSAQLHAMLGKQERDACRLIKVDIEGAEGPFVNSFLQSAGLYPPGCEVAMEISPGGEWILSAMREAGFFAYRLINDYSDRDYLRQMPKAPSRHEGDMTGQCDFIFSRKDAARL